MNVLCSIAFKASAWKQRRDTHYTTTTAGALIMGFLASKNMKNKFLLFINFLVSGTFLQKDKWTKKLCAKPIRGMIE